MPEPCSNNLKPMRQRISPESAGISAAPALNLQALLKGERRPPAPSAAEERWTEARIRKSSLLERREFAGAPELVKGRSGYLEFAANFLGGGILTGNKLDGFHPEPNFRIWKWLIEEMLASNPAAAARPELKKIRKGIDELLASSREVKTLQHGKKDPAALVGAAERQADKVHRLRRGESCVMYGGYGNMYRTSGHALIYEFIRSGDKTFTVQICTSTGFQLTGGQRRGDKLRLKPIVRYTEVPEERLFFNRDGKVRPWFFQSLMELKVLDGWGADHTFEEEDVLEIFDRLERFRTPVSLEEYGAITGQRGGTCVPSVTKVWVRSHSGKIGLYKQIMFQVKLRLLIATYHKVKEALPNDDKEGALARRLLSQVAKNLLRRTDKCLQGMYGGEPLIDEALAEQAIATAKDVLEKVARFDEGVESERKRSAAPCNLGDLKQSMLMESRKNASWVRAPQQRGEGPGKTEMPSFDLTLEKDGSNLFFFLEKSCESVERLEKGLRNRQVAHCLDRLPLPKSPFWEKITDKNILNRCIEKLERIAIAYDESSFYDMPSRRYSALFSLQALIHFLSLKADPSGLLQQYAVPYEGGLVHSIEGVVYFEAGEFERLILPPVSLDTDLGYNEHPKIQGDTGLCQTVN